MKTMNKKISEKKNILKLTSVAEFRAPFLQFQNGSASVFHRRKNKRNAPREKSVNATESFRLKERERTIARRKKLKNRGCEMRNLPRSKKNVSKRSRKQNQELKHPPCDDALLRKSLLKTLRGGKSQSTTS